MNFETQEKKEKLKIEPVDCVVVLGRGVEKVEIKNPDGSTEEVWKPTRYIQKLDETGMRTGKREAVALEDEQAWVGGGKANTIASIEYYHRLEELGLKPKLFILSAGRPAYLENEPEGFCEAIPMKEIIDQELGSDLNVLIQSDNRNTKDDVLNSLKNAQLNNIKSIAFINTSVAMPRTQEFYKLVIDQYPELAEIKVTFYTAEDLLAERYADSQSASAAFDKIQTQLKNTGAWKNTSTAEQGGIDAIKSGKYGGRGNY